MSPYRTSAAPHDAPVPRQTIGGMLSVLALGVALSGRRSFNAMIDTGVVLMWIVAIALALSGCGMSQLERHTTAAGILHAGTGIAASVVDQGAREAAARADDEAELQEALRPWRQAEAVQHLAAAAVDAYVAEVLVMAATDAGEPDTTRALRALRGAVSAYAALADLLATLGVDIPPVGRVLAVVGELLSPVERAALDAREWVVDGIGAL